MKSNVGEHEHILSQEQIVHAQMVELQADEPPSAPDEEHLELQDMSVGWYTTPQDEQDSATKD